MINYCMACGFCTKNGYCGCPKKTIVIVMTTPVYFYTMYGQLKTLIGRCCTEYTKINNKEFYFIMTAAEGNKSCPNRTIEEFRGFMACLSNVNEKGIIYGTGA